MTSIPGSNPQFDFINQVARCASVMQKAFKQPVISIETIQEVEDEIGKCTASFPPHQQPTATDYLDMVSATPLIYVQNLKLLLHRHNLSPASSLDGRQQAVEKCVDAARDTAGIMQRTLQPGPAAVPRAGGPTETSAAKLRHASSAFLCAHVWRCILVLACSGDYLAALHCAQASAAIGRHRMINVACGRFLEFVLGFIGHCRPPAPHMSRLW